MVTNIATFWGKCNRSKWHIQPVSVLRKVTIFYFVGKIAKSSHILQIHLTFLLPIYLSSSNDCDWTIFHYQGIYLGGPGWNMYNNGSDFNDSDFKIGPFKIFLDGSNCGLYHLKYVLHGTRIRHDSWMTQIHQGPSHRKSIYYRPQSLRPPLTFYSYLLPALSSHRSKEFNSSFFLNPDYWLSRRKVRLR